MLCDKEELVRRYLVRGFQDRVFFAESKEGAEVIYRLKMSANLDEEVEKKEIYALSGCRIVAFEIDCENIQDDSDHERQDIRQALYILDDTERITHLVQEDALLKFQVNRTVDFSIHGIGRELVKLRDQDWVHVHITKRAMTIEGRTYSLQTNLSFESKLPNLYFG